MCLMFKTHIPQAAYILKLGSSGPGGRPERSDGRSFERQVSMLLPAQCDSRFESGLPAKCGAGQRGSKLGETAHSWQRLEMLPPACQSVSVQMPQKNSISSKLPLGLQSFNWSLRPIIASVTTMGNGSRTHDHLDQLPAFRDIEF